ncbi:MAG TPA: 3-phosphoshikimate 1-carboxyvinyltransferase [Ilumatobacteraceae bacterium]|nr:3-phosphoshikimate 1-carboxyvinyltransferase [Ilumatobacteraceae bacterium]
MTGHLLVPTATGPVDASVDVPGSKSIANRALVCAALADGRSIIEGIPSGDDTAALVECLGELGIRVEIDAGAAFVDGRGGTLVPGPRTLPARLAGTTSRFVTALAALGPGPYVIDGDAPLRTRPMGPLHDALVELGASVRPLATPGRLPVEIAGPATGGRVEISGDVSSQFVTALMLIGPFLRGGLRITLTSPLVSRPYVDMTASVMAAFGGGEVRVGDDSIEVDEARYAPTTYRVEPDATSAGYPLAVAAVAGGSIVVNGLTRASLQGDTRFVEVLAAMGCSTGWSADGMTVSRDPELSLVGLDVDMADMSDLVPTLAVVAANATTPTRIRGVGFIREKESDRLGDLATELSKTAARIVVEADGLLIEPATGALHGARLATHHDHRLAMAFGVLGAVTFGIEVEHPSVVTKSWPDYWQMLERVTGHAHESD